MANLGKPRRNEQVYPWASGATGEIQSLQPSSDGSIRIQKTGAGTLYSVGDSARPKADSEPAGVLSSSSTSFSLEKTSQNTFSLYQFQDVTKKIGKTPATSSSLSIEVLVRDHSKEGRTMGCPTLRYLPLSSIGGAGLEVPDSEATEDVVSRSIGHNSAAQLDIYHFDEPSLTADGGLTPDVVKTLEEPDVERDSLSGTGDLFLIRRDSDEQEVYGLSNETASAPTLKYATLSAVGHALSVFVDSEETPVQTSRSISHSDTRRLELYRFDDSTYKEPNLQEGDELLVRRVQSGEDEDCKELKYIPLSAALSGEIESRPLNFTVRFLEPDSDGIVGDAIWYCVNPNDGMVFVNNQAIPAPPGTQAGWNSLQNANEVWLNVVPVAGGAMNDVLPHDVANVAWSIDSARTPLPDPVFTACLARRSGTDQCEQLREGNIEFGYPVPDSFAYTPNLVVTVGPQKSIEYYKTYGLGLWEFGNGIGNSPTGELLKTFDGRRPRESMDFVLRDWAEGADHAQLHYMTAQAFAALAWSDSRIPNPLSKSIEDTNVSPMGQQIVPGAVGQHLYNFAIYSGLQAEMGPGGVVNSRECSYSYPITTPTENKLSGMDIVVRQRDTITNSKIPEVSYVPFQSLSSVLGAPPDASVNTPAVRSIDWLDHSGSREFSLYKFQNPGNPTDALSNETILARKTVNGVPTLSYVNLAPAFAPPDVDSSGEGDRSIGWNQNNELELYRFSTAAGLWPGQGIPDNVKSRIEFVVRRQQNTKGVAYVPYDTLLSSLAEDLDANADGLTTSLSVVTDVRYSEQTHQMTKDLNVLEFRNGKLMNVTPVFGLEVFTAVPELL